MRSASSRTTAPSSTASSRRSPTTLWSRRCGESWKRTPTPRPPEPRRGGRTQPGWSRARAPRLSRLALLPLLPTLLALAGCGELEYEGWLNRPVPITLTQDLPLVPLRFQDAAAATAIVDSGTPVTIVQISGSGQRLRGELRMQDGQAPEVTRFIFHDLEVFDLPTAALGVGQSLPIAGVLGVSLLQNFAVRLSYVAGAITLKDEIPDSNEELASDCAATLLLGPAAARPSCLGVFNAVPVGGGLVEVGGDSIELPASRLVVPLCLAADPFDPTPPAETGPAQQSGVSANAVVATGQGISLISRSAVERLRVAGARLTEQPPVTVFLPAGPETAPIVEIERVAAVSNETIELGPCGELARRRRLLVAGRQGIPAWDRDRSGASVAQVLPAIRFAVLEDNRPLIQGLRQELAPFVGDIDVVLGGSFLRHFEVDLDYRANRVILQCAEGQAAGTCEVLPFCSSSGDPRCPDRVAQ